MLPRCPPFPGPSKSTCFGSLAGPCGPGEVHQFKAPGRRVSIASTVMPAIDAATADELVETIRSFVRRDVVPVGIGARPRRRLPRPAGGPAGRASVSSGRSYRKSYGGLGLDVITYARIVEELAAGWMSLTGVLNTHMIAALLISLHGSDEQRRPSPARDGQRRAAGCPVACRSQTREATPAPSAVRPTGTATST